MGSHLQQCFSRAKELIILGDEGPPFVDTSNLDECFAGLSLQQKPPLDKEWHEIPEYRRPCHGSIGTEVDLIVNHFRTRFLSDKLGVYHYRVDVLELPKPCAAGRGRGRGGRGGRGGCPGGGGGGPQRIKFKEYEHTAFWEAMRLLRAEGVIQHVDQVIYDHFHSVWLPFQLDRPIRRIVPHPDEKLTRKWEVRVDLTFNCYYAIKLNHSQPNTRTMSEHFLKCLVNQRVKYIPDKHSDQWEFAVKWFFQSGHMFKVHNMGLYGSAEDDRRKVFPGVRAWIGLFAGAKQGEDALYMNIGLSNRLFYMPDMDLITFYVEIIQDSSPMMKQEDVKMEMRQVGMNQSQRLCMQDAVMGLKVKSTEAIVIDMGDPRKRKPAQPPFLGERHFKITGVAHICASAHFPTLPREFRHLNHSVEEMYYNLGRPLQYPNLPLMMVKSGASDELQPMEVLFVHDRPQKYTKMLDMRDLRRVIRKLCKTPDEYKEETDKLLAMSQVLGPGVPFLSHYGVEIDYNWTDVKGRVLAAPTLRDSKGKSAKMTKERIYQVKELTDAVTEVCVDVVITHDPMTGDEVLDEAKAGLFYKYLIDKMKDRGMKMTDRQPHVYHAQYYNPDPRYHHPELDRNTSHVMTILPDKPTIAAVMKDAKINMKNKRHILLFFTVSGSDFYGWIKYLGNSRIGVATQMVDRCTVDKALNEAEEKKFAIFYNIALKVNAKLGGVNMRCDMPPQLNPAEDVSERATVMYVGIDVTHPGMDTTRGHGASIDISLASMVGSYDYWGTRYKVELYAQMKAKEVVECFDSQFKQLMWHFYKNNDETFPKHVVVYRDGVSDSQMMHVASCELTWMKEAWNHTLSMQDDASDPLPPPTFTYIVVQKRHVTRFMRPVENQKHKYENPPSGTVVDNKVVSTRMFDFWMASHQGVIGTSRMAHYTVVYDEWRLPPDDIYTMSYRLAFLNARCRKPCSLPAPVFYADLACTQAKEMYRIYYRENPDKYQDVDPITMDPGDASDGCLPLGEEDGHREGPRHQQGSARHALCLAEDQSIVQLLHLCILFCRFYSLFVRPLLLFL